MIDLSIIIPVFNVRQYLGDCLDSILMQDVSSLEIILVDDGSTDGSGSLCDKYAERYPFIRVMHQANGGVSTARNRGLEAATGKWVSFVDPDDFVARDYIAFFQTIKESSHDLVFFSITLIDKNGRTRNKQLNDGVFVGKDAMQEQVVPMMWNGDHCEFFVFTVNKFFRREKIMRHFIRFTEGLTFREDELFTLDYFSYTQNFVTSSRCLYIYRCDIAGSLSHVEKPMGELFRFVDLLLEKITRFDSFRFKSMEYDRVLHFLINAYRPELRKEEIVALCQRISKLIKEDGPYLSHLKKTRLFSIICSLPDFMAFPVMEVLLKNTYRANKVKSVSNNDTLW